MTSGVNIDFTANLARFTSSIDKATSDLNKFQSNTQRISSQINGALGSLGVGLSAAAFVGFTKGIIDSADALNDLSKATGVSISTLSGFKLAAEQSGVELETVARGIQKFSAAIFEGSESTVKSLSRLGLNLQELKNQSPEEQFFSLAKALEGVAKEQRPVVLIDLLGQKLDGLAPLLDDGASGLRAMTDAGKQANKGLADLAPIADEFNDSLALLKQTSTGLFATLVKDALPSLNEYLKSMKAVVEEGDWLEKLAFFSTGYTSGRIADKTNNPVEQVRRYTEEIKKLKGELANINPILDRRDSSGKRRVKTQTEVELGIAEAGLAKQEARVRLQNQLDAEKVAADALGKRVDGGNSGKDKSAAKALAAAQKVSDFIGSLRKESALLGASEGQKKLFDAEALGITGKSLTEVKALADRIDAYKLSIENAKVANQEFDESFAEGEKNRESIEGIIGAFRKQNEQIAAEASLIGATTVERETAIRLRELEAVGLSKYSDAWTEAAAAIKNASETSRLSTLIGDAGFSKLKQDQEDAILLTKAFTDGIQQADGSLRKLSEAEYLDAVSARLGLIAEKAKESDDIAKELGLTFSSAFEDAAIGGKKFSDVLKGLAQDVARLFLRKTATEPLANAASKLFSSIDFSSLFNFANGGIMSSAGAIPLNKYAGGGIANSPQFAIFGEGRLNEAFVPLPDGRNIPVKLSGGGGTTINYYDQRQIDARGADAGVEQRIRRAMDETRKQSVEQAVSKVADMNARGQLRIS